MHKEPVFELTRQKLYDEIWEISVAGLARKHDISYHHLITQIKKASIPVPPPGYWSQLRHGKPTTKPELLGPVDAMVTIFRSPSDKCSIGAARESQPAIIEKGELAGDTPPKEIVTSDIKANDEAEKTAVNEPETRTLYGQTYNLYDRGTLYKEIWEAPVLEVAKRYQVSDVAIHKVCKALEIPKPPQGYWAKLRAGKPVTITPLPKSDKATQKYGVRTGVVEPVANEEILGFLNPDKRSTILSVASQILLPDMDSKLHPKIVAHLKVIMKWKKQQARYNSRDGEKPNSPFLADTVSYEVLPRVCRIIDTLIKAMEPLGCSLTGNLSFVIEGETVIISFTEYTDRVAHTLTVEENMKLLQYDESRRRNSWASKPKIRKYDYIFNGQLRAVISEKKSFRDCQSYVLEDRLGDILIELFQKAGEIKKARKAREEESRRREEEERLEEERRKHYNTEIDKTIALVSLVEDYDIACKIRRFLADVKKSEDLDDETVKWLEWAKSKADWYDPLIAREDEYFGKREHERSAEEKKLKYRGHWW